MFMESLLFAVLVVVAACLLLLVLFLAYYYQAYCYKLYYPKRVDVSRIRDLPYERKTFAVGFRAATTCYVFNAESPGAVILYLHGNRSNIIDDEHLIKSLSQETSSIIVYVDYRGYGGNDGLPSQEGVIEDASTVLNWIQHEERFAELPLVVCGMSLGAAIALHLLQYSKECVRGVIVINCFTTLREIAKTWLCKRCHCVLCFLKEKWDNLKMARKYGDTAPALFISSMNDKRVPSGMMDALFEAYGCESHEKRMIKLPGGHNSFYRTSERKQRVTKVISEFLTYIRKSEDDDDSSDG